MKKLQGYALAASIAAIILAAAPAAGAQSFVIINEVLADPATDISGDANRDGIRSASADEFVEVLNIGPVPVDISGWRIGDDEDGFGGGFAFPSGTTLAPGACALLFGGGIPTGFGPLTFVDNGTIGNGLGNSGEDVFLWDSSSAVMDHFQCFSSGAQGCADDTSLTRNPEGTPGPFTKHDEVSALAYSAGANTAGMTCQAGLPPPPPPGEQFAAGELTITEIMQNPRLVFDSEGEYFEIQNTSGRQVDLFGLIVKDDDFDQFVINTPVVLEDCEYAVLARNGDPSANGGVVGVDFVYGTTMALANGADEIVLISGVVEVDRVNYDGGATFPNPNGAAMELICPTLDNNVGANWRTADSAIGELAGNDFGSPGESNDRSGPSVFCSVTTDNLWPVNHSLIDVGFTFNVGDDCDTACSSTEYAIAVTSDESASVAPGAGGAVHAPDAIIDGDRIYLRAERSGSGDGRVYVITVTATDGAGNVSVATCSIAVDKSRVRGGAAVDSGQAYDPTAP